MIFGYLKKRARGSDDSDQRKNGEEMKCNIARILPMSKNKSADSEEKEPEGVPRSMSDNTMDDGKVMETQSNRVSHMDELLCRMDTLENKMILILDR